MAPALRAKDDLKHFEFVTMVVGSLMSKRCCTSPTTGPPRRLASY